MYDLKFKQKKKNERNEKKKKGPIRLLYAVKSASVLDKSTTTNSLYTTVRRKHPYRRCE